MEETLIIFKENQVYKTKILENFFSQRDIPNIYEFIDVVQYVNSYNNDSLKEFISLEEIRSFYLKGRRQIHTYLFEEHTWFSGIFNDESIEFRKETAKEELHLDSPIANFFGWKISEKSKFARNNDIKIFRDSLKIDISIIEKLKKENRIETINTWGTSISNPLIHLIISDFNKKTKGLAIASYFEIWFWNKENKIFESFDPEVPAREDNFNSNECLVYNNEIVFEFYKPFYVDKKWNVFVATIEESYQDMTSIGEPYDCAFYTITALNNFIDYLKEKQFEPKLYIHNC